MAQFWKKQFLLFMLLCVFFAHGCSQSNMERESIAPPEDKSEPMQEIEAETDETPTMDEVALLLEQMTLEEKVAQMFMVAPEAVSKEEPTTVAGEATKAGIEQYPVGGIVYFGANLQTPEQTKKLLRDTREIYEQVGAVPPLLAVDEEGGCVARIGGNEAFPVERVAPMLEIGQSGDPEKAYLVGTAIGTYLSELGFNMDFAPVADVLSNPSNQVIGNRSFGSDPELVGQMVCAASQGLRAQGIVPVIKHFPGHGATEADSHAGYAYTDKTLDALLDCELIPFHDAIENGIEVIMVGHISTPNVTDNHLPATLSYALLTVFLREQLGFDGIIITDAMGMGAITQTFSSGEAAVKAIAAGVDIVLLPEDFEAAYQGVLDAVTSGEISEARINASVTRILRLKQQFQINAIA